MKNIFRISLSAICLGLVAFGASAQNDHDVAMEFAAGSYNPVSAAMGNTGLASVSSTAWSALSNSAVLPLAKQKFDVQAVYQSWAPDAVKSSNIAAGLAYRFGKNFGMSLAFGSNGGEKFNIIDEDGFMTGKSFTPKDMQLALGAGVGFAKFLSAGVNLKYLSQKIAPKASYSAFAADVFVMARFAPLGLNVTAGISNIGSSVKADNGDSFSLPAAANAAASFNKGFGKHSLGVNADLNYFFCGDFTAALGAEFGLYDIAFIRAGYHYGAEAAVLPSFATVGLGVKFLGIKLNFAYLLGNDSLKGSMTLGLGYQF